MICRHRRSVTGIQYMIHSFPPPDLSTVLLPVLFSHLKGGGRYHCLHHFYITLTSTLVYHDCLLHLTDRVHVWKSTQHKFHRIPEDTPRLVVGCPQRLVAHVLLTRSVSVILPYTSFEILQMNFVLFSKNVLQ